jgi:hypothetical protein
VKDIINCFIENKRLILFLNGTVVLDKTGVDISHIEDEVCELQEKGILPTTGLSA